MRRTGDPYRRDHAWRAVHHRCTDLRLSRYFGTSEGYWLRLQNAYDLEGAKRGRRYTGIKPRAAL